MSNNGFQNRDRLNIALGGMARAVRPQLTRAMRQAGLILENEAASSIIDPPKTGRIYRWNTNAGKRTKTGKRRKAKWREHQASAPGESPAADTDRLHESITTTVVQNDDAAIVVQTAANTPYATRLEYGGSHTAPNGATVHIEPRPYMRPAYVNNRERIKDMIVLAAAQAIRKHGKGSK